MNIPALTFFLTDPLSPDYSSFSILKELASQSSGVTTSDDKDIAPFRAAALFPSKNLPEKKMKQKQQGKGTDDHILPLGILFSFVLHCFTLRS